MFPVLKLSRFCWTGSFIFTVTQISLSLKVSKCSVSIDKLRPPSPLSRAYFFAQQPSLCVLNLSIPLQELHYVEAHVQAFKESEDTLRPCDVTDILMAYTAMHMKAYYRDCIFEHFIPGILQMPTFSLMP
jgi:hypothetical protein